MDTLEKAEFTPSICHIVIFLKSGIPIYNSEIPDMAGRKEEKEKEKEEHRQLQSVMWFTQTQ